MATLLSLPSVGIGDLDVFLPSPPCLVLYTSYVDGEPESSVTYFWQDENTGMLHHEVVFMQPVGFEAALAWAQDHAPTRKVERIHVKHARAKNAPERKTAAKIARKKPAAKRAAAKKTAASKGKKPPSRKKA